jgi:aspartyl-tRNA(Asn)/glutamyl-tRNA(Gln) amidotransferase subunit A
MRTITETASALAAGSKSRGLVDECLARIGERSGEGTRTFTKVHAGQATAAADYYDRLRACGAAPSPFAGIPVSIKDLFDIAGDVTTAGSLALRQEARLRSATRRASRACALLVSFRSAAPT